MRFFDTLSAVVMTAGIAVGGYFGYFGFHDGMIKQAVDTTHVVLVTAVGPVSSPLFDVASWGPSVPVIVSPIGSIASPIDGIANTLITKHDKLEIERGNRQLIAFPTSMMEPRFVSALWLRPNIEVKSQASPSPISCTLLHCILAARFFSASDDGGFICATSRDCRHPRRTCRRG